MTEKIIFILILLSALTISFSSYSSLLNNSRNNAMEQMEEQVQTEQDLLNELDQYYSIENSLM